MPARHVSWSAAAAIALALLPCAPAAWAQTFKEPALEALLVAEKLDELQRVSAARVAAQPDDTQAVLGVALTALARNDAAARLGAIARAEACVEKQPRAAACQYALGTVLGIQAMSEGMLKAARSAGKVREALTQAQALEPGWYAARSALVEFHVEAPGFMGGSTSTAVELARGAPRPEQARALEARVAMGDKKYEAALATLTGLPTSAEAALLDDARNWAVQCGLAMVNAGQAAKAQPTFERLLREQPGNAGVAYALGRMRAEAGAHEEALKVFEQAAAMKGAADWPIAYRAGQTLQQLGRNDAAKASYARFVAAGKGPKSALDDARKRLEQLGG